MLMFLSQKYKKISTIEYNSLYIAKIENRPAPLSFVILYLLTQIYYFCAAYLGAAEPLCKSKVCTIKLRLKMKLNRIKAVLSDKGISQTWLAKQLDKSFSMVNAYACNRIQPNLETLQRIAEILQVDLKDLITDKDERQ